MTVQEKAPPAQAPAIEVEAALVPSLPPAGRRSQGTGLRQSTLIHRLIRYAGTSVASTVTSELVLLALFGFHRASAAQSAVAATAVGRLLSYLLSRYWIWADADRSHPARQMTLYWVITLLGLGISTWATSEVAAHTVGAGTLRTGLVGVVYLATYVALWVVKFGLYQKLLFRPRSVGEGFFPV